MNKYGNMVKGMVFLSLWVAFLCLILYIFSYTQAVGDDAFWQYSVGSALLQWVVWGLTYFAWYRKAEKRTADLFDIAEMRDEAKRLGTMPRLASAVLTVMITFIFVFFEYSARIRPSYSIGSAILLFFGGNLMLWVLMRFVGLPNRIAGN